MPLVVSNLYVRRNNPTNAPQVILLEEAWKYLQAALKDPSIEDKAKIVLVQWYGDKHRREFAGWNELAAGVRTQLTTQRENYFFKQAGENLNPDPVIYRTDVPTTSIGWTETEFFERLGDPQNMWWPESWSSDRLAEIMTEEFLRGSGIAKEAAQGLKRRAEQEYLMQNMVKGALWEAAQVADEIKVGIAVRPTGLSAHMGIESGDPTKAQEFKNKTSKEEDVILCEEMDYTQIGSVVHYDPRVEWNSRDAQIHADLGKSPMFAAVATEADWKKKEDRIKLRLKKFPQIEKKQKHLKLKKVFDDRSKEYLEEDHEYRKGHYAPYTTLVGPYIRLKLRPELNMVGDHDLFAFTNPDKYGTYMLESDPRVARAQKALQNKPTFQAQHGGIWYWQPTVDFNVGIKNVIMSKHGPEDKEPLVHIRPGYEVTAAYYDKDNLKSVWSDKSWTKWMEATYSGRLFLNPAIHPNKWDEAKYQPLF